MYFNIYATYKTLGCKHCANIYVYKMWRHFVTSPPRIIHVYGWSIYNIWNFPSTPKDGLIKRCLLNSYWHPYPERTGMNNIIYQLKKHSDIYSLVTYIQHDASFSSICLSAPSICKYTEYSLYPKTGMLNFFFHKLFTVRKHLHTIESFGLTRSVR